MYGQYQYQQPVQASTDDDDDDEEESEFDIPTDITSKYQGKIDDTLSTVDSYLERLDPLYDQYMDVMGTLSSPGRFSSSVYPIQKNVNQLLLNNLANRGIISSSMAENAFTTAAEQVPRTYMNQLLNIAGAYNQGIGQTMTGIGQKVSGLGVGSYYTGQELEPYQMMTDILLSM